MKCNTNLFITTWILIILRAIELNLTIICHDDSNDAESTITTPEVQTYHFALRGNMLGLIYKITTGTYLRELHEYEIYFTI